MGYGNENIRFDVNSSVSSDTSVYEDAQNVTPNSIVTVENATFNVQRQSLQDDY